MEPEEHRYYLYWCSSLYLPSLRAAELEEAPSAQASHQRDLDKENGPIAKNPTTVLAWLVQRIKDVTEPKLDLREIQKLLRLIQKLQPYELTLEDAAYLLADVFNIWQWLFENEYVPAEVQAVENHVGELYDAWTRPTSAHFDAQLDMEAEKEASAKELPVPD